MSITVIDYGSGNLRSAAKALEAAVNNTNINGFFNCDQLLKIEFSKETNELVLSDCYTGESLRSIKMKD